jgi:hypothetical protein
VGPAIRVRARPGAAPLGAIFGGIGLLGGAAVALLGLDRIPLTLCVFKGLTGVPCPTCGSTRTLARLATGDVAGAMAMNPAAALAAAGVALWALADLALLPGRRALAVEASPRLGRALRAAVPLLLLLNWAYLVASGR